MSITINIHTDDDFDPQVRLLRGGHVAPFASIALEGAELFLVSAADAGKLIHAARVAKALLETPAVCETCAATEDLEHHVWTALADGSVTIHWLCRDIPACNDWCLPRLAQITAETRPEPEPEPRNLPGELRCSTSSPGGYICTARRGHGGNHTAHGQDGTVCHVWPRQPAPAAAG